MLNRFPEFFLIDIFVSIESLQYLKTLEKQIRQV